jgi:hypothetical protein
MAGFAGLRRSELVREYAEDQVLRWEDINWQKQLITVRHEVAKSRERANLHAHAGRARAAGPTSSYWTPLRVGQPTTVDAGCA